MGHLIWPLTADDRFPCKTRVGIQLVESYPECTYEANERLAFFYTPEAAHAMLWIQVGDAGNKLE